MIKRPNFLEELTKLHTTILEHGCSTTLSEVRRLQEVRTLLSYMVVQWTMHGLELCPRLPRHTPWGFGVLVYACFVATSTGVTQCYFITTLCYAFSSLAYLPQQIYCSNDSTPACVVVHVAEVLQWQSVESHGSKLSVMICRHVVTRPVCGCACLFGCI